MKKPVSAKICLAASAGGHLTQLRKIAPAWSTQSAFWVTTGDMVANSLDNSRVYAVGECNRKHPFRLLAVLARCAAILLRERPDIIISTGAAPGCIMCLLGKLLSAKIIWLDSITNVERLSLSGRLVRPFADLFLVQWPELAKRYPNAEYIGAVI
jgi:UDP-N-acetylglucosamine:LPS N-acetylglucosamine transferase